MEKKFLKTAIDHKASIKDEKISKKGKNEHMKSEFMKSQRIQNISNIKKRNEELDEKSEFALI